MRTVKISACQFSIARGGFDDFRTRVEAAMGEVPRDSHWVLFPELFTVGLLTVYPDAASVADLTHIVEFTPRYRELFHQSRPAASSSSLPVHILRSTAIPTST